MQNKIKITPRKIVPIIITSVLLMAVIAVLSISFIFTDKEYTPVIFGRSVFVMNGSNMEPAIPDKSAVFVKVGKLPEKAVGTVALCKLFDDGDRSSEKLVTVLRVVGVETVDGQEMYLMKSDKNTDAKSIKVSADKVVGQAVSVDKFLGMLLVFATSQMGILLLVIVPSIIFFALQLIHILKNIKEKDDEQDELEDLNSEIIENDIIKEEIDDEDFSQVELNKEKLAPKSKETKRQQENVEDDTEEISAEEPVSPKVLVDRDGKAEYIKTAPTADVNALNKILKPVSEKSELAKPIQKITRIGNAEDTSKGVENILNQDALKKHFESNRNSDEGNSYHSPIKPVSSGVREKSTEEFDTFIAPKPKKSSTNKTLEELMKMLDREENKTKNE